MRTSLLSKIAAWLLLLAVVAATLVPVEMRPTTPLPLKVERALAFAILTFVFTTAYPQRWAPILALICVAAIGLELMQFLVPTRDPSLIDAGVKVIGAVAGTLGAWAVRRIRVRTAPHRSGDEGPRPDR